MRTALCIRYFFDRDSQNSDTVDDSPKAEENEIKKRANFVSSWFAQSTQPQNMNKNR